MKNFLLLTLLIFSVELTAQKNPIYLSFGGNFSTLGGNDLNGLKAEFKPGYFIGISLDDPISEKISIEAGIDYSRKSYGIEPELKYNVDFFRASVFGRYNIDNFFLMIGPELNLKFKAKLKLDSKESDVSGDISIATFGPSAGFGLELNNNLSAFTKYHHNFIKFFSNESKIYSRTIDIGLKYRIR